MSASQGVEGAGEGSSSSEKEASKEEEVLALKWLWSAILEHSFQLLLPEVVLPYIPQEEEADTLAPCLTQSPVDPQSMQRCHLPHRLNGLWLDCPEQRFSFAICLQGEGSTPLPTQANGADTK